MSTATNIPSFQTIAFKIYCVISACLTSTVIVAAVAIYQFISIGKEIENIAEIDAPLTSALTEVTIHQLEQAILFERAMRAGEVMETYPDQRKVFDRSVTDFRTFNEMVDHEIEIVRALLSDAMGYHLTSEEIALFQNVDQELEQLAILHVAYAQHAEEAFAVIRDGKLKLLLEKLPQITVEEEKLDHGIENLLFSVEKFTVKAAIRADSHENEALSQMILISTIAILLGASASFFVVRRHLTFPIREVSDGVAALCRGDFSATVEKKRDDEIGTIADGLGKFRENALKVESMAREKAEIDAQSEASRKAMLRELRDAFGTVVDGAVSGDLSGRVSMSFDDEELNDLSHSVNKLLGIVEEVIKETARVMSKVAEGHLGDRMDGEYHGGLSTLQGNVNQTIERLADLVDEIGVTTSALLSNAEGIRTGSTALASTAEQQASSLEQTAATMEEMSASVKSNADGAARASDLAAEALSDADAGGRVIDNAIDVVNEIEKSSARVNEIITVIDGIAFQTNLLALNAAVEAARAGDAGKGFAVVASEVRALAQRSAEAASDIKQLLEGSATQISIGVDLVKKTGRSLEKIVDSIGNVSGAISAIASASSEQATGIQEITLAMGHLDGITQSNATAADQGASNAKMLTKNAAKLKQLIDFFEKTQMGAETATSDVRHETRARQNSQTLGLPMASSSR